MEFSQRLPLDWLQEHVAGAATHYLFPAFVHQLSHRPEVSPQWRCELLLTVRTGERILSLLDVLPAAFQRLPETLDLKPGRTPAKPAYTDLISDEPNR